MIDMKAGLKKIGFFLLLALLLSIHFYFKYQAPPFAAIPSRSMEPLFKIGTLILVEPVQPIQVQVGDIIVIKVPREVQTRYQYPPTIVHRVVKINQIGDQLSFRLKGDNNNGEDPFSVLPEQVMGKVRKAFPYAGYPILFFYNKQGYYFLISMIALYLAYILWDAIERRKKALRQGVSSWIFADVLSRIDRVERLLERQNRLLEKLSWGQTQPLPGNYIEAVGKPAPAEATHHEAGDSPASQSKNSDMPLSRVQSRGRKKEQSVQVVTEHEGLPPRKERQKTRSRFKF